MTQQAKAEIIKRIHNLLSLYQNYFQPSQKLVSKTRIGAKIKKKYDTAQTPCQRLLSREDIPQETKTALRAALPDLNPAHLLPSIQVLVSELYTP